LNSGLARITALSELKKRVCNFPLTCPQHSFSIVPQFADRNSDQTPKYLKESYGSTIDRS
jgi:hypothetical protein